MIGTLEAVINLMYGLSTQDYAAQVDLSQLSYVAADVDRVAIYTLAVSQQLQPRQIIVALYRAVLGMYWAKPGFCAYYSSIVWYGQLVGLILINDARPTTSDGSSTTSTSLEITKPPAINGTSGVGSTSGIAVDSEDPRLSVNWKANSRGIPAKEILTSVVDGIADVAAFDIRASCQPIVGTSPSGRVTFNVRGNGYHGTMLCGMISKVFRLIANSVIVQNRIYKDMDLIVRYNHRRIGWGKIRFAESNSRTALETS